MAEVVKDRDLGWTKIKTFFQKEDGKSVKVGVQGDEATESNPEHGDLTNAELASIHEYGKGVVPQRPWISQPVTNHKEKYAKELEQIGRIVSGGEGTLEGELMLLGEMVRGDIIKAVKDQEYLPLADPGPRAGETPLWDTGQMINSLSAVVVSEPPSKVEKD